MFRRKILEKPFFGQKEKKNWQLSDIFPSSRPNRSLGCVKIQHSTPPNEQLAGKKKGEIFYFVYLFLGLEDKILFIRGKTEEGCQIVSRRLVRQKGFCAWEYTRKKLGIDRIFLGLSDKNFAEFIKFATWMSIGASINITFFCQFFLFLKCFWTWSANLATPGGFFLQFSQNCLRSQRNILRWSVFSQKGFVFLLKVYGKVTKKFLFFCSEINAGGLNCNLYFKRSNPRIFLTKKLKVCCDKQFRTFGRKFRYDCQKSIQH